jgi:uncharacterized membrane protein (UPF0136 family)
MKKLSLLVLIYGVLILIGGIIGHIKAGSQPSLVMGIAMSVLLLLSSFAMYKEKKFGYYAAIVLAFFLDAFFSYRFTITHSFFPAGFMSLVSLAVLIMLLLQRKQVLSKRN